MEIGELFVSRDAMFYKDKFPYCSQAEEDKGDMGYRNFEFLTNFDVDSEL